MSINPHHNEELLKACKTLKGYSIFVSKVRKYIIETKIQHRKTEEEFYCIAEDERKKIISEAVNKAIDWCIKNDILKDFFLKYRKEAVSVSVLEYSAERHMQAIRDESFDLGLDKGITGAVKLLKEMNLDNATILQKICETYELTPDQAKKYL